MNSLSQRRRGVSFLLFPFWFVRFLTAPLTVCTTNPLDSSNFEIYTYAVQLSLLHLIFSPLFVLFPERILLLQFKFKMGGEKKGDKCHGG